MSSREMLEAAGRAVALPPRTVLAGDARVLLLALPVGAGFNLTELNIDTRKISTKLTVFYKASPFLSLL